jgi:signal transduction histidine kinase
MSVHDLDPSLTEEQRSANWERMRSQGTFSFETVSVRRDGEAFPVEITVNHLTFDGLEYNCVFARDIAERKWAEKERQELTDQLVLAQKMESIGRLAGGVAHDFNNMLGVILGNAELALTKMDPADPAAGNLVEIQKAAEYSADLTHQLLAFARRQTVAPKVLDLNQTIGAAIIILRRLLGEDIDLAWVPASDIWQVKMDPAQFDQVLMNLATNARDSITGVGRVSIETANVVADEAYVAARVGLKLGEYVVLAVSDSGEGMDQETLANIFEPFYTTKERVKGKGLGLATVYGIAQQNGGIVSARSEPGEGTTFKVHLPRHSGETARGLSGLSPESTVGGSETVLLVEDDPMLLSMTKAMLERLGYAVLPASTPREAIRLASEHADEVQLLVTDVVMPEMNGRELADELCKAHPGLKHLFISGYTADVIADRGVLEEGVHFVQKPFSMHDLAAKMREALDE